MHFAKVVILFAGLAAAAPAATTTSKPASTKPASSSTKPVSTTLSKALSSTPSKAPSVVTSSVRPTSSVKPVVPSSTAPASNVPTALVSTIFGDLNAWHASMDDALAALDMFTGGLGLGNQAGAVGRAGDVLQSATVQLLIDSRKLSPYGQLSAADSAKYTELFVNHIALDAVRIFQFVQDKKALFTQVGAAKSVSDGLKGLKTEIQQIGDALGPHFATSDLPSISSSGTKVFVALQNAINAYP